MYLKNDSGGISLLVLFAILALLTLVSALGLFSQAVLLANSLNQKADIVALSAARYLISDPNKVCPAGSEIAEANQVNLVNCLVTDDEVLIQVTKDDKLQFWLSNWKSIGVSRAGIDYLND